MSSAAPIDISIGEIKSLTKGTGFRNRSRQEAGIGDWELGIGDWGLIGCLSSRACGSSSTVELLVLALLARRLGASESSSSGRIDSTRPAPATAKAAR